MTEYIIETKNLTKLYHGSPAVNQINLQVPQCSIYGFLGPNGAGKSTTMKMLLGLAAQDKGSIQIFGREMNASNRIAILSQVGSLIESPSYYGNLTGYENLKISCTLRNLPHSEINEALRIVRLDNQKHKKTSHYSLGMKQRLGIANACWKTKACCFWIETHQWLRPLRNSRNARTHQEFTGEIWNHPDGVQPSSGRD